jgi:hypothetical protein
MRATLDQASRNTSSLELPRGLHAVDLRTNEVYAVILADVRGTLAFQHRYRQRDQASHGS